MNQFYIIKSWINRWIFKRKIYGINENVFFEDSIANFKENVIPRIKNFIELNDLNILDIGCGYGGAIKYLDDSNRILGIEVNDKQAKFAKSCFDQQKHVKIINESIFEAEIEQNFYDLVIASDISEHIPKTSELISIIKNSLKDGGYCYLSFTPYDSIWGGHIEFYLPLPFAHKIFPKTLITKIIKLMGNYSDHISSDFVINQFLHLNKINVQQLKEKLKEAGVTIVREWSRKHLGIVCHFSCIIKK